MLAPRSVDETLLHFEDTQSACCSSITILYRYYRYIQPRRPIEIRFLSKMTRSVGTLIRIKMSRLSSTNDSHYRATKSTDVFVDAINSTNKKDRGSF